MLYSLIAEEIEQSGFPFLVELVAWKNMHPTFQELISQDLVRLEKKVSML